MEINELHTMRSLSPSVVCGEVCLSDDFKEIKYEGDLVETSQVLMEYVGNPSSKSKKIKKSKEVSQ